MKRILILITAVLMAAQLLSAGERKVISVETDNTSLVILVLENGRLETIHYGARLSSPEEFVQRNVRTNDYNGQRGDTYPATGGRFVGEPALHVRYADGSHNTELYYTGHEVFRKDGCTGTTVHLKDPVTALEVDLVYDAYGKEDVILQHTEIRNGGKAADASTTAPCATATRSGPATTRTPCAARSSSTPPLSSIPPA